MAKTKKKKRGEEGERSHGDRSVDTEMEQTETV